MSTIILYMCPVLDSWFAGFQKLGVPPRNYLLALLVVIFLASRFGSANFSLTSGNKTMKWLVVLIVLMYTYMAFVELIVICFTDRQLTADLVQTYASRVYIGLFLAIVTTAFLNRWSQVELFVIIIVLAMAVSALVAILQFADVQAAYDLRYALAPPLAKYEYEITRKEYLDRVCGLSAYSISFGYNLVNVIPLALAVTAGRKSFFLHRTSTGPLLLVANVLLVVAAIISETRAVLLALVGSIGCMIWVDKRCRLGVYKHGLRIIAFMGLVVLVTVIRSGGDLFDRWDPQFVRGHTVESRLPSLLAGLLAGWQHPLGLGVQGYTEVASDLYSELQWLEGSEYILTVAPHNHIVNNFVAFGFPGLVMCSLYYIILFRLSYNLARNTSLGSLRVLSLGCFGCFIAEFIYAQTHNAGPFHTDIAHWYVVGLLFAAYKLQLQFQDQRSDQVR